MKSLILSISIISLNFSLLANTTETCYSRTYDASHLSKYANQSFQKIDFRRTDYKYEEEEGSYSYIEAWTPSIIDEANGYEAGFDYSAPYKKGTIFCESTNGDAGKGDSGCIYVRASVKNPKSLLISPTKFKKIDDSKGIYINTSAVEFVRCLGAWGDDLDCYGVDKDGNLDSSKIGSFQMLKWSPSNPADKTYLVHPVKCKN